MNTSARQYNSAHSNEKLVTLNFLEREKKYLKNLLAQTLLPVILRHFSVWKINST